MIITARLGRVAGVVVVAIGFYLLGAAIADRVSGEREAVLALRDRIRAALDEPDAIVRTAALTRALRDVDIEALEEVAAVYDERVELDPPSRTSIEILGETWAALDPEGAIERIYDWPEGPRAAGIPAVTRAWARRAPNAAFAWATTLVLDDRVAAVNAVFAGWAESDDPKIWNFLATLTAGLDRESATNVVMKSVVNRHGFDELFAQVDAIESNARPGSPRDFKLSALRTAIGLCAYHEPDKALVYARRYAGGPFDNGLLRRLAVYWAVNDGARAMEALLALPREPERDKALRDGYLKWLRSDRPAAIAWVPAEAAHDPRYAPLLDHYAVALAYTNEESPAESVREALVWAERIEDPKRRRDTQVHLGALWMAHEPELAKAWIDERGLAQEVEAARALREARKEKTAARARRGR